MDEWDIITGKLDKIPFTDRDGRDFARFFFSNAIECEMDKQGRIGIPQDLREFAGLVKDVCFAGARNYVEVWDYGTWKDNSNVYDSNADELAEKMQKYLGLGDSGQ
jgi:MraZ protein